MEDMKRKAVINSLVGKTITSELKRQVIMHALLDEDKKLMDVNISKAIDAQFEQDDLDEMLACGMSTQDVVDYINDKFGKLNEINESLGIALHNLNVLLSELTKRGGNYNDQT